MTTYPTAKYDGQTVTSRILTFESAQEAAQEHGLRTYIQWRADEQRSTNVMPSWWYRENECQQHYTQQIESDLRWQAEQKLEAAE